MHKLHLDEIQPACLSLSLNHFQIVFVTDTHLDDWTPHKTRQRFVCPSPIPASPPTMSLAPPPYLPHGSSQGEGFSTMQAESVNFHCRERERCLCVFLWDAVIAAAFL